MTIKKLAILAALMALTSGAFAQGTVIIVSRIAGSLYAPVYLPEPSDPSLVIQGNAANGLPAGTATYGGGYVVGTGFTAELWGGASAASLQAATGTGARASFRTSTSAGVIGTIDPATINGAATITGVPGNSIATLQLRVWDNQGGTITSWADALAAGVAHGVSATYLSPNLGGTDPGGGPDITPTQAVNLRSFNLQAVPEPTTLAMLGLGAAALLVIRRRK